MVSTDEVLSAVESRSDVRIVVVEPDLPGCLSGVALARHVMRRPSNITVILLGWPGAAVPSPGGRVRFAPSPRPPATFMDVIREALGQ